MIAQYDSGVSSSVSKWTSEAVIDVIVQCDSAVVRGSCDSAVS